jgi:hypothetical protein
MFQGCRLLLGAITPTLEHDRCPVVQRRCRGGAPVARAGHSAPLLPASQAG